MEVPGRHLAASRYNGKDACARTRSIRAARGTPACMQNDPVLAVAVHAARRAAAVLVDAARDLKRRPSHAKDHADIVFNADTEAENAMIATLRAAFPEHAIVGKEAGEIVSQIVGDKRAGDSRAGKNALRWIVDPLDGAVNFRHGYPNYAVSV